MKKKKKRARCRDGRGGRKQDTRERTNEIKEGDGRRNRVTAGALEGALEGGGKLFQMQFLALSLAAQILLEPLLLWAVGWTPGKLLLGIRVTGREGERLTFRRAVGRTFGVLTYGQAFCVPTLREIRGYVCLRKAEDGELLPWEQDTQLVFRKVGVWNHTLVVLIYLLSVVSILWVGFRQVC